MPNNPSWLFLTLGCAFFSATTAALSKIILKRKTELFVFWAYFAFSLPFFLVIFVFAPKPHLTAEFWKTASILMPLELAAFLMYLHAIKISPISLVFPFLGFTPVFTILTSSLILREKLPATGVLGVLLVSLGAYLLNANTIRRGLLEPIRCIYRERGSMLMLFVALIYGLTTVLGKKAALLAGPLALPAIYYSIFLLLLTPFLYVSTRKKGGVAFVQKGDAWILILLGALFAVSILLHYTAIVAVNVSYMISVKRLSLVISVIYGAVIFKEKNIGCRLLGALVMLAGVSVLSLF